MKKLALITAALVSLAAVSATSALALGPVTLGASADYASRYIWRGFDIYDNGDAFQPGASATVSPIDGLSLGLGVWASYNVDGAHKTDEIDYSFDASYELGAVTVSGGYIYYYFPLVDDSEADDTGEIYLGVSTSLPYDIGLGVTAYYDHDDGDGVYVSLGADWGTTLAEGIDLSLGTAVGYMNYDEASPLYAGYDGVSDITFSAGISADLGGGFGLSASANAAIVPDEEINTEDEFWTMVGLSYEI